MHIGLAGELESHGHKNPFPVFAVPAARFAVMPLILILQGVNKFFFIFNLSRIDEWLFE